MTEVARILTVPMFNSEIHHPKYLKSQFFSSYNYDKYHFKEHVIDHCELNSFQCTECKKKFCFSSQLCFHSKSNIQ